MKRKSILAISSIALVSLFILTVACFGLGVNVSSAEAATADTTWYNGTDTTFTLDDVADLEGLAAIVNAGTDTFDGKTVSLGDAFDNTGSLTTPIGTSDHPFSGTFDGKGKTVNLSISNPDSQNQGMFGYANGVQINNVTVAGSVEGYTCVGGIVGRVNGGFVEDCTNTATITGHSYEAGGIAGETNQAIVDCVNTGNVNGNNRVGGIVGFGSAYNSYNTASVTATGKGVGGIVGFSFGNTVTTCYNVGSVSGGSDVGGIVGEYTSGDVTYCYWSDSALEAISTATADSTCTTMSADGKVGESPLYQVLNENKDSSHHVWYLGESPAYATFTPPHTHEGIEGTFTQWTTANRLPSTAGKYYLTDNVTLTSTTNIGAEVVICLNGKTVTTDYYIRSTGNLTLCSCTEWGKIEGNVSSDYTLKATSGGTINLYDVTVTNASYACISANSSCTVNVYSGTYTAGANFGVYNSGTFNISGGSLVTNGTHAFLNNAGGEINVSGNAYLKGVSAGGTNNGTFTMTGGTLEYTSTATYDTNYAGVINGSSGTAHIGGGTLKGLYGVQNEGTLYLSGNPTFDCTDDIKLLSTSTIYAYSADDTPIAYGGSDIGLNFNDGVFAEGAVLVNGVTADNGAKFSVNKTDHVLLRGTEADADNLVLHIHDASSDTCSCGQHSHDDGATVYNKWTAESGTVAGGNYYLADNVTATGELNIQSGQTVVLCLNGKNLDLATFSLVNYGTLTILDCQSTQGIISNTSSNSSPISNHGAVYVTDGTVNGTNYYAVFNNSTGTVFINGNDAVVTSSDYAVYNDDGKVEVSNGTVVSTAGRAIYNKSSGTVSINGANAVVTSPDYTVYNFGKLEVSNGTVTSTGTEGYAIYNLINGTVFINGANTVVTAQKHAIFNNGKVEMSNGTVTSTAGYAVYNNSYKGVTFTMTGGNLNTINDYAIYNVSATVNISGGTVTSTGSIGISNASSGSSIPTATLSGGTVSGGTYGIINTGTLSISGTAEIVGATYGINNRNSVEMSGGTVTGSTAGINNESESLLNMTGGTVISTGASYLYPAIYLRTGCSLTASGGNVLTENGATGIYMIGDCTVDISPAEDGDFVVDASHSAIYATGFFGTANICGGTYLSTQRVVQIISGCSGNLCIKGGIFTTSATDRSAIYTEGAITLEGGTFSSTYYTLQIFSSPETNSYYTNVVLKGNISLPNGISIYYVETGKNYNGDYILDTTDYSGEPISLTVTGVLKHGGALAKGNKDQFSFTHNEWALTNGQDEDGYDVAIFNHIGCYPAYTDDEDGLCDVCDKLIIFGSGTESDPYVVRTGGQIKTATSLTANATNYISTYNSWTSYQDVVIDGSHPFVFDMSNNEITFYDNNTITILGNGTIKNGSLRFSNGIFLVAGEGHLTLDNMDVSIAPALDSALTVTDQAVVTIKESFLMGYTHALNVSGGTVTADMVTLHSSNSAYNAVAPGSIILDGVSVTTTEATIYHTHKDENGDCICDWENESLHSGTPTNYVPLDGITYHKILYTCCDYEYDPFVACTATPDGDCTTDDTCVCGHVIVAAESEHRLSLLRQKDDTHHYLACSYGGCAYQEEKEHSSYQYNNLCTTASTCKCGYVLVEAFDTHDYVYETYAYHHVVTCSLDYCTYSLTTAHVYTDETDETCDVCNATKIVGYGITVAGVEVTELNASDVLGELDEGSTVIYNPTTNTLTLNNANIIYGNKYFTYAIDGYATFPTTGFTDVNLHLVGENVITATGAWATGINAANLVVTADEGGSLKIIATDTVKNGSIGIFTNGTMTIDSGEIWISADKALNAKGGFTTERYVLVGSTTANATDLSLVTIYDTNLGFGGDIAFVGAGTQENIAKTVKLYPHVHAWASEWTNTTTHHYHECTALGCFVTNDSQKDGYGEHVGQDDDGDCTTDILCAVCGEVATVGNTDHTGGTATCTEKAHCTVCDTEYGEKDTDNHSSTTYIYVNNDNGTHTKKHECCNEEVGTSVHSYVNEVPNDEFYLLRIATCITKAVYLKSCECGLTDGSTFEYGEVDPTNHADNLFTFSINEDGTHNKNAHCCGAILEVSLHSYGEDDRCICGATVPVVYTVTVENGSVGGQSSAQVTENGSVTVTANVAPDGKVFTGWMVNGTIVATAPTYTFIASSDVTISAVYSDLVDDPDEPQDPSTPDNPSTPDTPNSDGLSGGAIAGIVIGSVVFSAGIAVLVVFLLKKKRK